MRRASGGHHDHRRDDDVVVADDAVKSTADDAALAKLSCVEMGYYDDPYLRPMSVGAGGLIRGPGGGGGSEASARRADATQQTVATQ